MRILLWALLLLLPALGGCTTGVLVANQDLGYERGGDQYVRLRLDTVQLDVVQASAGQFAIPGAICLANAPAGTAPCRALEFRLPFLAWNGTDKVWPLKLGMFQLVRTRDGAPGKTDTLKATDAEQTVALLPPHAGAHFDVLVHVAGVAEGEDPLRGEYRLTVTEHTGGAGAVLLTKDLSVGSFSQVSQIARFMGAATLLLVAAAAL